jgi:phosphoenolpyruvate phosphomutase
VAENAVFEGDSGKRKFDGFWSSSLADSTFSGYPDNESLSFSKRLQQVADIFEVTSKPLIFDADTGGQVEHFLLNIRTMKRIGVAACIIEDKVGLKKNSLFGNEVLQTQADPLEFANKITLAKNESDSESLMLIARIESLILEKGMNDALERSRVYIDAGADGIMIHSR